MSNYFAIQSDFILEEVGPSNALLKHTTFVYTICLLEYTAVKWPQRVHRICAYCLLHLLVT